MLPSRPLEPIPEDAALDAALGATVRNLGNAKENAEQLDGLIGFVKDAEKVSR